MRHEVNDIPSCDLSSFARPSPIVLPAPLTAFASACQDRGIVVPEIQVSVQEEPEKLLFPKAELRGNLYDIVNYVHTSALRG